MKKLALAAALSVAASTAFAGGFEEPVVEPVIIEETNESNAAWVIPVLLLGLIAVSAAG